MGLLWGMAPMWLVRRLRVPGSVVLVEGGVLVGHGTHVTSKDSLRAEDSNF